jgi:hypothetical protein
LSLCMHVNVINEIWCFYIAIALGLSEIFEREKQRVDAKGYIELEIVALKVLRSTSWLG